MHVPAPRSFAPATAAVLPAACTKQRLRELQQAVDAECKGGWVGCNGNMSCAELSDGYYGWLGCQAARDQINNECFDGGDVGHQQAAADAGNAAARCDRLWRQFRCG